jgi:hypothetical protein
MKTKQHTSALPVSAAAWALAAVLFAAGCASSNHGAQAIVPLDLKMPAAGKSEVVFYRTRKSTGKWYAFRLHDDDRLIGRLVNGSCFAYECEPGRHILSSSMENFSLIDADLQPDRIYYVKVEAKMGINYARVGMTPVYPGCPGGLWEKLPGALRGLPTTSVSAEDAETDQRGIAKYIERLKKYEAEPRTSNEKILPGNGQPSPAL